MIRFCISAVSEGSPSYLTYQLRRTGQANRKGGGVVLDAPGNEGTQNFYTAQIVASWPFREGFFGRDAPIGMPASNDARRELLNAFAETWAEPFRGFVLGLPEMVELKPLELSDWVPPRGVHGRGRVVLAGDAFHPMAMC